MDKKAKGTRAERELLHLFWENGYACMRAPGSGSMKYPGPDIIAGKPNRRLAIECKSTKAIKQYLTQADVDQLKEFSDIFGCEPWFAIRFDDLKDNWFFITIDDLEKTKGNNYVVTLENAKRKGLLFEEVI